VSLAWWAARKLARQMTRPTPPVVVKARALWRDTIAIVGLVNELTPAPEPAPTKGK
jgi:hypothetical protein